MFALLVLPAAAVRRELSAGCLASQGMVQTAESTSLIVVRGDDSVTLLDSSVGTGAAPRPHTVGPLSPLSPGRGLLRGHTRLA